MEIEIKNKVREKQVNLGCFPEGGKSIFITIRIIKENDMVDYFDLDLTLTSYYVLY